MEFILNQGDPMREKKLLWNEGFGFNSENSADEKVKYSRAERALVRDRV
jgi:hypothetical protein